MEEARAFIKDPYLGRNYITCIEAVMQHRTDDIEVILSSRIDKWKFRASLTLFEKATFSDADRSQYTKLDASTRVSGVEKHCVYCCRSILWLNSYG